MSEPAKIEVTPLHIALLRIAVGIFFFTEGLSKLPWFSSSGRLLGMLHQFLLTIANGLNRWFIEGVAIRYADLWTILIPAGEMAIGASLLIGLGTRLSIPIAIFMVLVFHFTDGTLFQWSFFANAYAFFLLFCLVLLSITKAGREFSLGSKLSTDRWKVW